MRENKFRAWDSYQCKIYEWADICRMDALGHLTLSNLLNGLIDHIQPLEYTGLKDKNGVEIYEGDIVKYYIPNAERFDLETIIFDQEKSMFRMQSDNVMVSSLGEWLQESWTKRTLEVIGNIYENPELLEDKNVETR